MEQRESQDLSGLFECWTDPVSFGGQLRITVSQLFLMILNLILNLIRNLIRNSIRSEPVQNPLGLDIRTHTHFTDEREHRMCRFGAKIGRIPAELIEFEPSAPPDGRVAFGLALG